MEIKHLLEQYFDGLTSSAEEATLRRFFTMDDVPDNLLMYKPLFAHFDSEIKKRPSARPAQRMTVLLWLSGVAAFVAVLMGSFFFMTQQKRCPGKGDYVVIDGRCYTDASTIHRAIQKTLLEVSEVVTLPSDEKPMNAIDIVGNQLKEFDFLMDE